jgi:hypothetical protein
MPTNTTTHFPAHDPDGIGTALEACDRILSAHARLQEIAADLKRQNLVTIFLADCAQRRGIEAY